MFLCLTIFLWTDNYWYLSRPTNKHCTFHYSHMKVASTHLKTKMSSLPKELTQFISNSIRTDVNPSAISKMVLGNFGANISTAQIQAMKEKEIDEEVNNFLDDPLDTTMAETLLAYFKTLKNVSYIFLCDEINSGLVTHTVKNRSGTHVSLKYNEKDDTELKDTGASWRRDLSIKRKTNPARILVCLGWSFDYEVTEFSVYGQFIAIDTTFGLNRNERSVLFMVGSDGSMSTSTFFRCIMPSKRRQAFTWAFEVGATFCLGSDNLKATSCYSSD